MLIKVSDYTKTALSADDGVVIRNQILSVSDPDEEITLDFSGITLYATMFFNAFIGYFVLNSKKDLVDDRIKLENISALGQRTFEHSYNNAVFVKNNSVDMETAVKETLDGEE